MAFNNRDANQRKLAGDYARGRTTAWYNSPLYTRAVNRYEINRDAYYRKARANEPVWKSKLYFGTFFIACKAFEAKIKSTLQPDIATVKIRNRNKFDAGLLEKERIAEFDLRNDMRVSDFYNDLVRMYWFNQVGGVSVARESFTSDVYQSVERQIIEGQYGEEIYNETERLERREHTKTDVIHPLNFAHDPLKGEFTHSDWGSVRYPLPIREVYRMLSDPIMSNDPSFIKEDIRSVIQEIEKGGANWSPDKGTTYYCDTLDTSASSGGFTQNSIIVEEYSGDLNFRGNYNDATSYFGIFIPQYNKWLRIGKSPFRRHPYWKMRTYPDPLSPFGVGACDLQVPIGILKNSVMNQYIDWGNANLKYMYEVYPGYIRGGLGSLISGLPGGLVEASSPEFYEKGPMIRPVQKQAGSIPAVSDIINFIERAALDASPVSNSRSEVSGRTDTATGIMQESKREDDVVASMVSDLDHGLQDGLRQKMANRIDFAKQAVIGQPNKDSPHVRYFPFELDGPDYIVDIDRTSGISDANKYMAFIGKLGEAMKMGLPLSPEAMIPFFRRIGRRLDIPEAEEAFADKPVEIGPGQPVPGAPPQAPSPEAVPAQGPAPVPAPAPVEPPPQSGVAQNALALAA